MSFGQLAAIQSRTSSRKARSAGLSSEKSVVLSHCMPSPQPGESVVDRDFATLDRAAAERDLGAVLPHLGAHRLARKNGSGETRLDARKMLGLIVRERAQNGMRSDTEARHAVQDRPWEACGLGALGVDVQRVGVSHETKNQRQI